MAGGSWKISVCISARDHFGPSPQIAGSLHRKTRKRPAKRQLIAVAARNAEHILAQRARIWPRARRTQRIVPQKSLASSHDRQLRLPFFIQIVIPEKCVTGGNV